MKIFRILPLILVLLPGGCIKTVTMNTRIEPDGTVERQIKIEADKDAGKVSDGLVLPDKSKWKTYKLDDKTIEASGTFKSVAEIPDDFVKLTGDRDGDEPPTTEPASVTTPASAAKPAPVTEPASATPAKPPEIGSKSVKTYTEFNCDIFTAREYTETITNTVMPENFFDATERFIALRSLLFDILEQRYADMDFSKARNYVEEKVLPEARRLAFIYWDLKARRVPNDDVLLNAAIIQAFKNLGAPSPWPVGSSANKVFENWATGKLAELVKYKNGQPLTAEQINKMIQESDKDAALQETREKILAERYGSGAKFDDYMEQIGKDCQGAYQGGPGYVFAATLELPHQKVDAIETNGTVSNESVLWFFRGKDVFPEYKMFARIVTWAGGCDEDKNARLIKWPEAFLIMDFAAKLDAQTKQKLVDAFNKYAETRQPDAFFDLEQGDTAIPGLRDLLSQLDIPGPPPPAAPTTEPAAVTQPAATTGPASVTD